jgi:hypothetical protein
MWREQQWELLLSFTNTFKIQTKKSLNPSRVKAFFVLEIQDITLATATIFRFRWQPYNRFLRQ